MRFTDAIPSAVVKEAVVGTSVGVASGTSVASGTGVAVASTAGASVAVGSAAGVTVTSGSASFSAGASVGATDSSPSFYPSVGVFSYGVSSTCFSDVSSVCAAGASVTVGTAASLLA